MTKIFVASKMVYRDPLTARNQRFSMGRVSRGTRSYCRLSDKVI